MNVDTGIALMGLLGWERVGGAPLNYLRYRDLRTPNITIGATLWPEGGKIRVTMHAWVATWMGAITYSSFYADAGTLLLHLEEDMNKASGTVRTHLEGWDL